VRYDFCRVYVSLDAEQVRAVVEEIEGPSIFVEVRRNDNRPHRDDDFIYWPTCVEIAQEPDHSIDLGIVEATRRVIGAVQSAGGRAVASADFEEQL
jgi:hypothetical protein